MTKTEYGYLALADISGYNAFVAGTEFDHAQEIISELLEFLVIRLRPLLPTVQIEGDAVFAYTPEGKILRGETLFELIENTYVAFKDRLVSIKRHHTCTCAACQNINMLDLKFFIHFGEYFEHSIDDHHGLLGYAPMFVRKRTWKEPVAAVTDWRGYALFTDASLSKLDIKPRDLQVLGFADSPLKTYGLNLQDRYQVLVESRKEVVSAEIADASLESEFDASPPIIWEWLNDPQKRNLWWASFTRWTMQKRPGGRTGPGAVNHCNHGVGEMLEKVLDWQPFDYFTVTMHITPGHFDVLQTTFLKAASNDKTEVTVYYRLQNPRRRWMARPVCRMAAWFLGLEMKHLKRVLAN